MVKPNQAHKETVRNICRYCNKQISKKSSNSISSWVSGFNKCKCNTSHIEDEAGLDKSTFEEIVKELPPRYKYLKVRGSGGMGWLVKVLDKDSNSECAVKLMKANLVDNPIAKKRFDMEAATAISLDHDNLVSVVDHGLTQSNAPYIVMKYESGMSLEEILQEEVYIDLDKALNIFLQICDGMIYAHSKGIVHRDLKPANIIINDFDGDLKAKIIDFGIAYNESENNYETMTRTGEIVGSPLYMSPEQCRGETVDHRTDIYSLGCIMYEVLTGHPPFAAPNPVKVIILQMSHRPLRFNQKCKFLNIPESVERIVFHCMEKSINQRYQYLEELARDLESIRSGTKPVVIDSQLKKRRDKSIPKKFIAAITSVYVALILAYIVYLSQFDTLTLLERLFKTGIWSVCLSGGLLALVRVFKFHISLVKPPSNTLRLYIGDGWLALVILLLEIEILTLVAASLGAILSVNEIELPGLALGNLWSEPILSELAIGTIIVQLILFCLWIYRRKQTDDTSSELDASFF